MCVVMKSCRAVGSINVISLWYVYLTVQSKVVPLCPYADQIHDLMELTETNVTDAGYED